VARRLRRLHLDDLRASLFRIALAVDVWPEIVEPEAIDRGVGGRRVEVRGLDERHFAPGGQLRRRDVLPAFASVPGEVYQTVVGARPNRFGILERGGKRVNDAAVLALFRIRAGGNGEVGRYGRAPPRQIGAEPPALPAGRLPLEKNVGGEVQRTRLERRKDDRLRANVPVLGAAARIWRDVLNVSGG